jgi:hypothetical protein
MISVIQTPPEEATAGAEQDEDYFRIPAGGRWMPMDWERIGAAFQSASDRLGWDADLELLPERQRVIVKFPPDRAEYVGSTMFQFHRLVSREIGMDEYMSIWIDFMTRR